MFHLEFNLEAKGKPNKDDVMWGFEVWLSYQGDKKINPVKQRTSNVEPNYFTAKVDSCATENNSLLKAVSEPGVQYFRWYLVHKYVWSIMFILWVKANLRLKVVPTTV